MGNSTIDCMEIYHKLSQLRYNTLTPSEQRVVRLGGIVIACQIEMNEYKKLGQMELYHMENADLEVFMANLNIAVANISLDK